MFLLWFGGNVPSLIKIFPVVSGAIGGLISGIFAVVSLYVMKLTKKPHWKILIGLGFFVLTVLICYLIALAILSAAK